MRSRITGAGVQWLRSTWRRGLPLLCLAGMLALSGCDARTPSPSPVQPTTEATPTGTLRASAGPASPIAATPSPVIVDGTLGGYWRVQETPEESSGLAFASVLDRHAFLVYKVRPGCQAEPCDEITIDVLLPTYRTGLGSVTLHRDGAVYASGAGESVSGPCVTAGGSSLDGGATVTETMRVWLQEVRRTGSAVVTTELHGEIELAGTPTPIGASAGCRPWTFRYLVAGSRTGAPADSSASPTSTPGPATAGGVDVPKQVNVTIKGATVAWFNVTGSTLRALVESIGAAGVKACGRINYEWYSGDTRPAGCMKTAWRTLDVGRVFTSGGACRTRVGSISASYTVELPRWVAPASVPKPLATWWRAVVRFIADHEAGHVAIARRWVAKLPGLLDRKPCGKVEQILDDWAAGVGAAQEQYDRDEYSKPWPPAPAGY